jgi:hypothetical protein
LRGTKTKQKECGDKVIHGIQIRITGEALYLSSSCFFHKSPPKFYTWAKFGYSNFRKQNAPANLWSQGRFVELSEFRS